MLSNSQDIRSLISHTGNAMSVIELADVSGLGVIETHNGQVTRIHEKSVSPPSHLANAGLYLFTPDIFSSIDHTEKSTRGEYELTDSIQILINSGQAVSYQTLSQLAGFKLSLASAECQ